MNFAVVDLLYCVRVPGLNPACTSAVSSACLFSRFKNGSVLCLSM